MNIEDWRRKKMNDGWVLYGGPYDAAVVVEYVKQYGKNQITVNMIDQQKNLCRILVDEQDIPVKTTFEKQIDTQIKIQKGEY